MCILYIYIYIYIYTHLHAYTYDKHNSWALRARQRDSQEGARGEEAEPSRALAGAGPGAREEGGKEFNYL